MAKYMLDTNMCIFLMKNQPAHVADRLARCHEGDVVLSVVTLAELEAGISVSSEPDAARRSVQALIARVPVLPLSEDAARAYGPIRAATHERRADILDKLIAAHAAAENLIVITNSTRDFVDYPGLQIEDWSVAPPYRPLVDLATAPSDALD